MEEPVTPPLPPPGIRFVAEPGLRRLDGGRVLLGGSPLRLIRLSPSGAAVVDAWLAAEPLAAVRAARELARRLLDAGLLHPVLAAVEEPAAVTAIVPAFGATEVLDDLLGSLGCATVLVDDASPPDGAARLQAAARRHGARLVRRAVNGGPGAARMSGLEEVDTDVVMFVDSDVVLPEGWWPALAAHFEDPTVVAVAPRVSTPPGADLRERYERIHSPLDLGPTPARVVPRGRVSYVPTAALAVRRRAVLAVGGFDPALRVGEDVDLIWRLVENGGSVRFAPEVVACHQPRPSWMAMARQRFGYGRSAVDLTARHGALAAPARTSRGALAGWGLLAAGHPLVGALVGAVTSLPVRRVFSSMSDGDREAARFAWWGHRQIGLGLARATSRVWWPVALPVAVVSRRVRPAVAIAMAVPAGLDWWRGSRPTGPVRSVALRVADDMVYGAGVWAAALRRRDGRALLPELVEWPGRRSPVEPDTVEAP